MTKELLLFAFVIAACGCLNTFAGGRFIPDEQLRGRNLYYATPLLFLVAWIVLPWQVALIFACGFAFWRVWAWGHLFGLGRFRPTDRPPSFVETICLEWSNDDPHIALWIRHLLSLPTGLALAWWYSHTGWIMIPFALAAGIVLMYELGWQWKERVAATTNPILIGEVGAGVLWGAWIVFASA